MHKWCKICDYYQGDLTPDQYATLPCPRCEQIIKQYPELVAWVRGVASRTAGEVIQDHYGMGH